MTTKTDKKAVREFAIGMLAKNIGGTLARRARRVVAPGAASRISNRAASSSLGQSISRNKPRIRTGRKVAEAGIAGGVGIGAVAAYQNRKKKGSQMNRKNNYQEPPEDVRAAVWNLVEKFEDEEGNQIFDTSLSDVLAGNIYNADWPLKLEVFTEDDKGEVPVLSYSDDDVDKDIIPALDGWIKTVQEYTESLESANHDDGDDNAETFEDLDIELPAEITNYIKQLEENQITSDERELLQTLGTERNTSMFSEQVKDFSYVPGTIQDKAEKLDSLFSAFGEDAVKSQLDEWGETQRRYDALNPEEHILAARNAAHFEENVDAESMPATAKVIAHAKEHKLSPEQALAALVDTGEVSLYAYSEEQSDPVEAYTT